MQQVEKLATTGPVHSVQSFADSEPALSVGGLRWDIYQHKEELLEEGVIFYIGRKLLIDRDRYFARAKGGAGK